MEAGQEEAASQTWTQYYELNANFKANTNNFNNHYYQFKRKTDSDVVLIRANKELIYCGSVQYIVGSFKLCFGNFKRSPFDMSPPLKISKGGAVPFQFEISQKKNFQGGTALTWKGSSVL